MPIKHPRVGQYIDNFNDRGTQSISPSLNQCKNKAKLTLEMDEEQRVRVEWHCRNVTLRPDSVFGAVNSCNCQIFREESPASLYSVAIMSHN